MVCMFCFFGGDHNSFYHWFSDRLMRCKSSPAGFNHDDNVDRQLMGHHPTVRLGRALAGGCPHDHETHAMGGGRTFDLASLQRRHGAAICPGFAGSGLRFQERQNQLQLML